jgi:hypothetical protein
MKVLTPILKYSVSAIDPKYAAVKGRRGVDIKCVAYAQGPIMAAHEARNKAEPKDQLVCHEHKSASMNLDLTHSEKIREDEQMT